MEEAIAGPLKEEDLHEAVRNEHGLKLVVLDYERIIFPRAHVLDVEGEEILYGDFEEEGDIPVYLTQAFEVKLETEEIGLWVGEIGGLFGGEEMCEIFDLGV